MAFYKKRAPINLAEGEKQCARCEKVKPLTEFRVKSTGKVNKFCNHCCGIAMSLFRKHNEDGGRKHYKRHNELLRNKRRVAIQKYGGKCACCGVSDYEFLALDHENGGGNEHRRKIGDGGTALVLWVTRHGFPTGFRVLCHNCNNAMKGGRMCPHQRRRHLHPIDEMIYSVPKAG